MTTTEKRPTPAAGPVVCQPWCTDSDGHPGEVFAMDQSCYTEDLHIPLSRPGLMQDNDVMVTPEWLSVYARQDPGAGTPVLVVSVDGMAAPDLTPAEAHHLIETLQLILGQVSA